MTAFEQLYPGGAPQLRGSLVDGRLEGWLETFAEDGSALARISFAGGQLDGPAQFRATGGALLAELSFREGRQDGECSIYQDGRLAMRQLWREGELASAVFLDEKGRKVREMEFSGGVPHGKATEFYPDGGAKEVAEYAFGKKHGVTIEYNERGKPVKRTCYAEGKPVKCPKQKGWL